MSLLLSVGEAEERLTYLKLGILSDTVIKPVSPQQAHTVYILSIYPI